VPLPFGLYRSPGATKRSLAFEKQRSEALDVAEPLVARSLRDAFKPPEQSALERFQRFERSDRLEFEPSRSPTGLFSDRLEEGRPVPNQERTRKPGIPSLIEDVFRQVGRVAGGPGLEDAFLPENAGGLAPPIPRQLVDVETRAATRYAALLEETRQSFPAKTPPGTTIESLALERLDEEMGEELRAAQPQQEKGLFGKLLSAGLKGAELAVFGKPGGAKEALEVVGAGIGELEKTPAGGPLYRQPGTGKTAFEEGAEISRPVVRAAQPIVAEPFEQVEAAGIPGVSPVAGGVSDVIQSQIVEDIGTEVINPAALVLVAPIALQAASGLRGVAAAEALVSNLLATGLEPALVRGTLRGLTVLGRDGLAGLSKLSKAVRETPIIQEAVRGLREAPEAGGGRLAGEAPPLGGGGVAPPREPPTAPPPPPKGPGGRPRGPDPDDDVFRRIQDQKIIGEKPEITLIRRHEGAIQTARREAQILVDDGNNLLRESKLGQSFRGTIAPKAGQVDEFDEMYRLLHSPSKVRSGELVVPERLRPAYDKLRELTDWEQVARLDFDPEMALVEDYFYRGWKPPEGMFKGGAPTRGPLGRKPGFKLPRVDATFEEMRAAGFEPIYWNPFEQWRASRMMGVRYREQTRLVEDIKKLGLAQVHAGGPIPEGWRVPRVGPAFEGKPFAIVDEAGNPRPMFTRRWIVPDTMADRLENVYGVVPQLGTVEVAGRALNLAKVVDALVFIPKRAKLVASVFQHVDFLTRSGIGAWTGLVDALRAGRPVSAVRHLAKWPDSAGQILRASVSPKFRQNLRRMAMDTTPLVPERPGLTMKAVSEAGLSLQDVTILPANIDQIAREVAQEAVAAKAIKAPGRALAGFERVHRQGLFQGVYPAAILTDVKNNIAPIMVRNFPDLTDAQLAGQIAKVASTKYSTIPASMSVVQNRTLRGVLTRTFFSLGENEGLLRQAAGALRGPEAVFWREHWLGAFIGLIATANVIHFASTGQPLPFDRYSPISRNKWGPLPIGYNRDFAAPNIPLTGRSGTALTLDLVGQLDTALRILDPAGFISARESVPVRAAANQIAGTDFFGAPIDEVGPQGIVSRTSQLIFDMFAPIGIGQAGLELARNNIEGAETIIRPGEDRLGTGGTLTQATGVNLRAETTPQLLDRIRGEVMREMGIGGGYQDLDPGSRRKVNAEVEARIGQELEQRRQTSLLRGQQSPFAERRESVASTATRIETEQLAPAAQGVLRGDPLALDSYNNARDEFFTSRHAVSDAETARLGIEPSDFEAKTEQQKLVDDYYALEPEDLNGNGFIDKEDMDTFFKEQDAKLAQMDTGSKRAIKDPRNFFTDPDVIRVEETRLEAIEAIKAITALPKWEGLTLAEGEKLDDLVSRITADVQRFKAQAAREGLEPDIVTFRSTAAWLLDRGDITELDAENAIAVSSRKAIRERGRIDLALENRRVLLMLFPNFLDSVLPVDVERGELTESEINQLEPAGVR